MIMEKSTFIDAYRRILTNNGLEAFTDDALAEKFYALTVRMLEVNEYMNLTAITDLDGVILKHYADSLTAAKYLPEDVSLIDIGCGAGFPSLVLAMAFPALKITAIDSTGKKIDFVTAAAEEFHLTNLRAVHGRSNELNRMPEFRNRFDIVTARAVATAPKIVGDAPDFPKRDGRFILYKTPAQAEEDLPELKRLAAKFQRQWHVEGPFALPGDCGERCFLTSGRRLS